METFVVISIVAVAGVWGALRIGRKVRASLQKTPSAGGACGGSCACSGGATPRH